MTSLKYFAYGSNMSLKRIQHRVPSAKRLGLVKLVGHQLCFHKNGTDGSGKCDAFETQEPSNFVWGALFEIDAKEKPYLDKVEGVGSGYEIKDVTLLDSANNEHKAYMYYATDIVSELKPYPWYLNHVVTGAKEIGVPHDYLADLVNVPVMPDTNEHRAKTELAIHK